MFKFNKKKQPVSSQPMVMQLTDAHNRSLPVPININATDIVTLLAESIHLAKLVTTEKRDLEVIRSDYMLMAQKLQNDHEEIMSALDKAYSDRSKMIDVINENAKILMDAGQYAAGHAIMNRMIDLLALESPLEKILNSKR